tara:strand:- start:2574 stop:3407 length:834 start_codon:yes stop_codon:yes gene_type:complete
MKKISFQGVSGAYSDLVCQKFYKSYKTYPCDTFETALLSVKKGLADLAMIPIENSIAGRVSDMHVLLEYTDLKIIAEYFHRIEHHLLIKNSSSKHKLKNVYSHLQALYQCKKNIKKLKLSPINFIDTAAAAKFVSQSAEHDAAIASDLAAKTYGLKIIKKNLEDQANNVTRFLVFARKSINIDINQRVISTLTFKTKNLPASLYKALGGFATNGINLTRLENFFTNKNFNQSSFIIDVECHPKNKSFLLALEELKFYSSNVRLLGFYKASNFRTKIN